MGYEYERERLKRRILSIQDEELKRELRRYRYRINKKPAILERQVHAKVYQTPKGARYAASDEIFLCHKFLDQHGVEECYY